MKNTTEKVQELLEAVIKIMVSYENYCADEKPEEQWDEYDHMMYPKWMELRRIMKENFGYEYKK